MHGRLICGTHADRVIASNFAFELSLPELSLFPSLRTGGDRLSPPVRNKLSVMGRWQ